ncbi:MAG: WG repeat-containing protein [Ruminococcaceae bacterium]|nr:WG repeat-containing protein [Oscillospiraceae bacterium]
MKSTRFIVTVMIAAVCAFGWIFFLDNLGSDGDEQAAYLKKAEEYYSERLYELSIEEYEKAISIEPKLDIYRALITACEDFYAEERTSAAQKRLLSAYSGVNDDFPEVTEYWEQHAALQISAGKYQKAMTVLNAAEKKGITSELLAEQHKVVYWAVKARYQEYETISKYAGAGAYTVTVDGLMGIVSNTGEDVLAALYSYVGPANENGDVLVQTVDGEAFILDKDGVKLGRISARVAEARAYSEGMIAVRFEGREDWCFIDNIGNELFGGFADAGRFSGGKAAVQKADGSWILIGTTGEQTSANSYEGMLLGEDGSYINGSRLMLKKNGAWGLYDASGEMLGTIAAEEIDLCRQSAIAYKKDGKWGFMKRSGEVFIEPQYEDARSFSCGAAAVKQNGKWGFINTDGELIIDFIYDDAGYFEKGGSCPVIPEGQSGYSLIYWTVSH